MPKIAILLIGAALTAGYAQALAGQEQLRALLDTRLNGAECFRVRDLFLEREDVKFYLNDGHLIFAEPYLGRDVAALFIAEQPSDSGEVLVIPPSARERRSLALVVDEGVLDERFRSALFLFTDDTAERLRQEIARNPASRIAPEQGETLASKWSPVLRNILESVSLRILVDSYSNLPLDEGFFAAAVGGGKEGRFDVVVDPRQEAQVSVGKSTRREGRTLYDTWTQFEGLSYRQGRRKAPAPTGRVDNYDVTVDIADDLSMRVVAELDFYPGDPRLRSFGFDLSNRLRMDALSADGVPVEFLQLPVVAGQGHGTRADSLLVLLPEPIRGDGPIRLRFEYHGRVISQQGEGIYFVSNRGNWYPRTETLFSDFDLTFTYPAELDLTATGRPTETSEAEGRRRTRFVSERPLRLAGFNLGSFVNAEREADGYTVSVRATRAVEERLQPRKPSARYVPLPPTQIRGRERRLQTVLVTSDIPEPVKPADRIDEVADSALEALTFFSERLGPPPVSTVTVTPIPSDIGQGFPGLVYAATLSYLDPDQPPLSELGEEMRTFYSKLLLPHELSHQWWGNTVTVESNEDLWLMESLATYSSLLLLEHREGPEARNRTLEDFRQSLLAENETGERIESAGPLVFGSRLQSSKFPDAYRVVLYHKGAWVQHMLRETLGTDAFLDLLRSLPRDFAQQELKVDQFRAAAAERLPANHPDPQLHDFFDQWVFDTGIPEFRTSWKKTAEAVSGRLIQTGVPEHYASTVTLRVTLADGKTVDHQVRTDGAETPFQIAVEGEASKVTIDPDVRLLRTLR